MKQSSVHIVSLVWYKILPANYGGQKVIASLNQTLGNYFLLTCLCSNNNQPSGNESYSIAPLLPTKKWQFFNPLNIYKILSFLKKIKATHLIIEHPYYAFLTIFAKNILAIKVIYRSHNIEYKRFKVINKKLALIVGLLEKLMCNQANKIFFITEEDKKKSIELYKINATKTLVIPPIITPKNLTNKNIARKLIAKKYGINNSTSIYLFNGTLDYLPNTQAVENISKYLIPELAKITNNFCVIVTGRIELQQAQHLYALKSNQLIIAGNVNNVDDYFLAADVYINTVISGGGVQTKILDALSYHLNVVCFNNMLNGIKIENTTTKIFSVELTRWDLFAHQVVCATHQYNATPNNFFEWYSDENAASLFSEVL